jgi:hypothetical protein
MNHLQQPAQDNPTLLFYRENGKEPKILREYASILREEMTMSDECLLLP